MVCLPCLVAASAAQMSTPDSFDGDPAPAPAPEAGIGRSHGLDDIRWLRPAA
jgi:hypothetical protein